VSKIYGDNFPERGGEETQKLIGLSISGFESRRGGINITVDKTVDNFLLLRDRIRDQLTKGLFGEDMQ